MFVAVFLGLGFARLSGAPQDLDEQAELVTSEAFLEEIRSLAKGMWEPKKMNKTDVLRHIRTLQTDRPDLNPELAKNANRVKGGHSFDGFANYDSRTEHSGCVGSVRDQADCGSCWAFAAAETFSDNQCVQKGLTETFSPQDLVSCDSTDNGCNGGTLTGVWDWIQTHGICSDECMPYTSGGGEVASCPLTCPASGLAIERTKCDTTYNMLEDTNAIKSGIFSAGSVEVGMAVYSDLMTYSSGIYKHTTGSYLGGHAVKAIGWGVEFETNYWLIQNSWGSSWGESGYFRIDMTDTDSDLGIGGGFNCGIINSIPTETPTPPPTDCKDISPNACQDISDKSKSCPYMYSICLDYCGCCEDPILQPSWCPTTLVGAPASAPARVE